MLHNSQRLPGAGETGSGKTTQLPKICMELGRGVAGMIGHTQPRRLAALAKQLVHEVVIDQKFINDLPAFQGRAKQQDKVHDNQSDSVLIELKEYLWEVS
ncbi:MAG: hypothetical protein KAJ95_06980 [Gammaproteobacteria bacterium]|nr:hypothetical protein [Gammaproteobacteria bacterium]